jgi:hypothetical protein
MVRSDRLRTTVDTEERLVVGVVLGIVGDERMRLSPPI